MATKIDRKINFKTSILNIISIVVFNKYVLITNL